MDLHGDEPFGKCSAEMIDLLVVIPLSVFAAASEEVLRLTGGKDESLALETDHAHDDLSWWITVSSLELFCFSPLHIPPLHLFPVDRRLVFLDHSFCMSNEYAM